MNTKLLIGFLAGALAASVGSYVLSHRQPAPPRAVSVVSAPAPAPAVLSVTPPAAIEPAPVEVRQQPATVKVARFAPFAEITPPSPVEIPQARPAPPPIPDPPPPVPEPAPQRETVAAAPPPPVIEAKPEPHTVTIPGGALINVRLAEALSSRRNQSGDTFFATLDQPLVVDGFVIAERGSRVEGRVVDARDAGRANAAARLALELSRISGADGQSIAIHTGRFEKSGSGLKGEDAAKIATVAAIGTVIGAAAGGGKGAAIGAAAGGAAGVGTVMAAKGKPVELPVETRIAFRLDQPVSVTEQLP